MSWRAAVCISLVLQAACVAEIREQCPLVTEQVPAPSMPAELARVDSLLVQRAICMTGAAHDLRGSMARSFRIYFAYETLPLLCARLEQARQLASGGRIREAGRKYQALLVASQVIELAISIHAFSEYADSVGVPTGRIVEMQAAFGDQMVPLLDAALSEDPTRIQRALADHGAQYGAWASSLTRWASQVNAQGPRLKVAKLVWDVGMLVVATYDAAAEAAEIAASGRPPIPPSPALVDGAGVAVAGMSPAAYVELAEALRKLVASGALDAAVVAGLSHLAGGGSGTPPLPALPTTFQMSPTGEGPTGSGPSRHIVLGLADRGLRQLSSRLGGTHLLDDMHWMESLMKAIRDPATRFTVCLEGFQGSGTYSQVMGAVQRGMGPAAKYTEWEMAQLYQAGRLGEVTFVNRAGEALPNPFR